MGLITAKVFDTREEAERVQEYLSSKGIISIVLADDCGGFGPYLGFTTGGYKLQINKEDCEKVSEYLKDIL